MLQEKKPKDEKKEEVESSPVTLMDNLFQLFLHHSCFVLMKWVLSFLSSAPFYFNNK